MVILSENPYEVPAAELERIKVEELLLQGRVYRLQRQGVAAAIARGMLGHGAC